MKTKYYAFYRILFPILNDSAFGSALSLLATMSRFGNFHFRAPDLIKFAERRGAYNHADKQEKVAITINSLSYVGSNIFSPADRERA